MSNHNRALKARGRSRRPCTATRTRRSRPCPFVETTSALKARARSCRQQAQYLGYRADRRLPHLVAAEHGAGGGLLAGRDARPDREGRVAAAEALMSSAERRDGPSRRPTCGGRNGPPSAATNLTADPQQAGDCQQQRRRRLNAPAPRERESTQRARVARLTGRVDGNQESVERALGRSRRWRDGTRWSPCATRSCSPEPALRSPLWLRRGSETRGGSFLRRFLATNTTLKSLSLFGNLQRSGRRAGARGRP